MGASVGSLFGILAATMAIPISALTSMAVCGVAAVTSSVVGALIAIVIIVLSLLEVFKEFALTSLIAVATSSFISHSLHFSYSFFDRQLKGRGFDLRMKQRRQHYWITNFLN